MPRVIQTTVYQYDELSDTAKATARDWYRRASADDNDFADHLTDKGGDFQTVAGFCGWTVSGGLHDNRLAIYWSGFWSQGDGACFEGTWSARDVNTAALHDHAPVDTELHRIVGELSRLAAELPNGIGTSRHSGRYSHEHSVTIDLDCDGEPDPAISDEAAVEQGKRLARETRALMRWLYCQLQASYDADNADDHVAEMIRLNEYEFLESGKRA